MRKGWIIAIALAVVAIAAGAGSHAGRSTAPMGMLAQGLPEAPGRSLMRSLIRPVVRPRPVLPGEREKRGGPAFEYEYIAPRSPELQPIHQRVREADLLHHLPEVEAIDGLFLLPYALRFVTAECEQFGAFYVPATHEVVLCYETLEVLYERGEQLREDNGFDAGYPQRYALANLRFIVLHETGHALIHLLDLPVTGRQEDAVDQLATMLMLHFAGTDESPQQVAENLRMAANWFLVRSTGAYNLDAYADEHALGEQRYFNLQCLLYGSDPVRLVDTVTDGDLPPARAQRCPQEAQQIKRAWLRLLLPHLAPKYEMSEAEANHYLEQQQRERERHGQRPYVRGPAPATAP
ncbi:DUF4344 domain-containing metallopeptidase [Marilutibacter alkalisoli]|nr:DUF4344 domain-containing metallopeptidase [Lysobacter alkalisoli]